MKKPGEIKGTHQQPPHDGQPPRYFECPNCGFLTASERFGSGAAECPICKAHADGRRTFPNEHLRRLDERIRHYEAAGESEIVVILAETFLEAILEDILDRMLSTRGADVVVREVVLDGQRAIGARIGRIFPQLSGEEFERAASELGYHEFPRRWREVRQARNSFIHDSPFKGSRDTLDAKMAAQAMELLDQAYRLFVSLNNRFVAKSEPTSPFSERA
ncbi:MAG: hypothetical protein Q8K89_06180 [Actinomycetota bacterium]|nr:hypothetical protein [Actinomycetota bacterium]